MFLDFLFHLRARGLKVSTTEWMTLMKALARGHADESMSKFYYLCRSICCGTEADFDLFDQCYLEHFQGAEVPQDIKDEFMDWLQEAKPPRHLTDEQKKLMEALNLKEVRELFEQRLKEQKERHDGGNKWIGTGGTSAFGHGGYNPAGIRVGGPGQHGMAMQIAAKREFRNFRKDRIIDTRQIAIALTKLREWGREGSREELDIDASIEKTSKNAGDIELVFKPERRNTVKLLLLMDVGGSMTYHSKLCETLFSAAYSTGHFKELRHYYFHNCPYETLYSDIELETSIATKDMFHKLDSSWFVFVIGDAAMSPYELTEVGGAIDYYHHNPEPGLLWIQRIKEHFPKSVWLNPEPRHFWQIHSNMLIRRVFPQMFPMSIEGIDEAIKDMKKR